MEAEQFTVRRATASDAAAISALVVDGFLDKFRPIFGGRMDRALRIMEKWVVLEHVSGGVTSLVTEGYSSAEVAGSVGVRTAPSREDVLARGLWRSLNKNLGLPRAIWATTLLSFPQRLGGLRRTPRRLPGLQTSRHRPPPAARRRRPRPRDRQGDRRPPRQRQQPRRPPPLRSRRLQRSLAPKVSPNKLLSRHPRMALLEEGALAPSSARSLRLLSARR